MTLRSLTLKDVAAEVGVHETTVSRIAHSKYLQTDFGIFELRYFFTNSISGAGSSGSALAGRLSEDPATAVLVLEAGADVNNWLGNVPTAAVLMVPSKLHNYAFETVPQPGLNGRRGYVPRGKMLGGSSGINAMVYIRGQREDYDGWAALGNTGWGWDDVLPYFIQSECNDSFGAPLHGQAGPLKVSQLRSDNPLQQAWVGAGREAGHAINADFNGSQDKVSFLIQTRGQMP